MNDCRDKRSLILALTVGCRAKQFSQSHTHSFFSPLFLEKNVTLCLRTFKVQIDFVRSVWHTNRGGRWRRRWSLNRRHWFPYIFPLPFQYKMERQLFTTGGKMNREWIDWQPLCMPLLDGRKTRIQSSRRHLQSTSTGQCGAHLKRHWRWLVIHRSFAFWSALWCHSVCPFIVHTSEPLSYGEAYTSFSTIISRSVNDPESRLKRLILVGCIVRWPFGSISRSKPLQVYTIACVDIPSRPISAYQFSIKQVWRMGFIEGITFNWVLYDVVTSWVFLNQAVIFGSVSASGSVFLVP